MDWKSKNVLLVSFPSQITSYSSQDHVSAVSIKLSVHIVKTCHVFFTA